MAMVEEVRRILEDHERRISALEELAKKKPRAILSQKKSTDDMLVELKEEGFFKDGKTISEVREVLHVKGRIVKTTDLPAYLLRLIRNETLKRARK